VTSNGSEQQFEWNLSWPPTAREGSYDLVHLLLADRTSWLARALHRTTGDRLQRSLHIPVEALSRYPDHCAGHPGDQH